MGVGKAVLCSHGPQAWCEVRMDHIAGPLHILLAEKEGRIWFDIICLKLYQCERNTWWCLSLLGFVLESVMKFNMLKKY